MTFFCFFTLSLALNACQGYDKEAGADWVKVLQMYKIEELVVLPPED